MTSSCQLSLVPYLILYPAQLIPCYSLPFIFLLVFIILITAGWLWAERRKFKLARQGNKQVRLCAINLDSLPFHSSHASQRYTALIAWHLARKNFSQILWILYIPASSSDSFLNPNLRYPSGKEPIKNTWGGKTLKVIGQIICVSH